MEHTPKELAHLIGDCTYEEAKVMLAAPELLEALEFEQQISLAPDPEAYPQFVEMRDAAIKAAKGDA